MSAPRNKAELIARIEQIRGRLILVEKEQQGRADMIEEMRGMIEKLEAVAYGNAPVESLKK